MNTAQPLTIYNAEELGISQSVLDRLEDYDQCVLLGNGTILCYAFPDEGNSYCATRPYYQTLLAAVDAKTGEELYRIRLAPSPQGSVYPENHEWPSNDPDTAKDQYVARFTKNAGQA